MRRCPPGLGVLLRLLCYYACGSPMRCVSLAEEGLLATAFVLVALGRSVPAVAVCSKK